MGKIAMDFVGKNAIDFVGKNPSAFKSLHPLCVHLVLFQCCAQVKDYDGNNRHHTKGYDSNNRHGR